MWFEGNGKTDMFFIAILDTFPTLNLYAKFCNTASIYWSNTYIPVYK